MSLGDGAMRKVIESIDSISDSLLGRRELPSTKVVLFWLGLGFLGVCFCLFWRLDSFPTHYIRWEMAGIKYQISKVFDGVVIDSLNSWVWTWGDIGHGGMSPVFGGLIEAGIRLFGLNLFGIRFFPVLLAFASILFFGYSLSRWVSPVFVCAYLLLLVSSPWYLFITRSGMNAGPTLSVLLVALGLFIWMFREEKSWYIALLGGIACGLLPYFYTICRPVPILLILLLVFSRKQTAKMKILYLSGAAIFMLPQIPNFSENLSVYFNARGESIMTTHFRPHGGAIEWSGFLNRIFENTQDVLKMLLGMGDRPGGALAHQHDFANTAVYHQFLAVPAVLGLLIQVRYIFRGQWFFGVLPILALGLSCVPGVAVGIPRIVCGVAM